MSRWLRFLIVVLIGTGAGLVYGWVVNPIEYVDTSPESLRADYKADYVLMVAEAYHVERDASLAAKRLSFLGTAPPAEIVQQAMDFAVWEDYAVSDLGLLRDLSDVWQGQISDLEEDAP